MKIVIDIPEEAYKLLNNEGVDWLGAEHILNAVANGTPLPKEEQVELEADGYADGELVYDFGKCPNCGWEFEEGDKDWEEPYCCHCGQKLKWFETEEEE